MQLRDSIISDIKASPAFQYQLAESINKSPATVMYWCNKSPENFMQLPVLAAICEYKKVTLDQVVDNLPDFLFNPELKKTA